MPGRKGRGWNPGGKKGKLHRELGVPVDKPIPKGKLRAALHSRDREVKDDAIRAETMIGWKKKGPQAHEPRRGRAFHGG